MKEALPIIIAIVLVLSIFYFVSAGKESKFKNSKTQEKIPECIGNESQSCKSGNCSGTKICINGRWGGCIINTICTPGENKTCYSYACTTGYKTCNECGTDYSECIF